MVELLTEPYMFKTLPTTTFMQTDEYNDFQGNIERKFENVDEDILDGKGMKELIYKILRQSSSLQNSIIQVKN